MTDWAWYLLLTAVLLAGLFLNVFGLPGMWIMIAAAFGYAWLTGFQYMGWWTLGIVVGLGVIAEILEFIAGGAGAKKAGGSRRAAWGALIGGLLGGFFLTLPLPV